MRRIAAIGVLVTVCGTATAQVVSPAGTMDVMLTVQHTHIDAHTPRGTVKHDIDMRSISATVSAEYSVTDRLALGASVPYIQSRYRGTQPHPGVVIDDGSMHGTLQDLVVDARYALMRGSFALSPFAGFRYPLRAYTTMGHTSAGRGLKELELGAAAGHQLAALPEAFIGASISYTISEAVHEIRVNRSYADLQLGYAVTPRLFVRGFGSWQRSHAGLDFPVHESSEHFHHHDQLARLNRTRAGAGVVFSLTEKMNVHAAYSTIIKSTNAHMGRSVSLGVSWTFVPNHRLQNVASGNTAASLYEPRIDGAF